MRVAIIMSTYNGEKYLQEQIDSVIAQDNVEIDLYIRDNCSTDNTVCLLKNNTQKNSNIFIEYDNLNLGFMKSFMKILVGIEKEYDYYAFCDQDDYWEKEKISKAIELISSYDNTQNKPVVYYSNLKICDEKLNYMHTTKLDKRKKNLESLLLRNSIAGCTMVFNNAFFNIIKNKIDIDSLKIKSHDSFLVSICYSIGGIVICDNNSYIKYRKHNNNASGSTNSLTKRIIKELKVFFNKGDKSKLANSVLNMFYDEISDDKRNILLTFVNSTQIKNRIKIFFNFKYSTGDLMLTIYCKLKALLGLL